MKLNPASLTGAIVATCLLAAALVACDQRPATARSGKTHPMNVKPPPKELVAKIRSLRDFKDYAAPDPIVSLEEFFTGNEDLGSIGCNLTDHPGMAAFYAQLKAIRERPSVQGVFVAIHELDEDTIWPFSECVYIITSAPAAEVSKWMQKLQPSEVSPGWLYKEPPNAPKLREGMRPVSCWWD
jgi:hypothetical protein